MKYISITKAYILWVLLGLSVTLFAAYTGEYWELMSQAVESTGEQINGITHDEMVISFIVISFVVWFFGILLGAFLVWMTNRQKIWAKYLLTVFCFYQIGWQIYGAITIHNEYEIPTGLNDWVIGIASIVVILYVGITPYFQSTTTNEVQS